MEKKRGPGRPKGSKNKTPYGTTKTAKTKKVSGTVTAVIAKCDACGEVNYILPRVCISCHGKALRNVATKRPGRPRKVAG